MSTVTQVEPESGHALRACPRARVWVVLVTVLIGALVAASGGIVVMRDDRRLAAVTATGEATLRLAAAISDLADPVATARDTLDHSADRVTDERVRAALSAALDEALASAHARAATTDGLADAAERVAAARTTLVAATSAVVDAIAAWELTQAQAAWTGAAAELDTALAAARSVLESSAGRVSDDTARQTLAAVILPAQAVRDQVQPTDVTGLTEAAAELARATDSLTGPRADVNAAVVTWEQEQAASAQKREAGSTETQQRPSASARKRTLSSGSSSDPYDGLTWVPNSEGSFTWCTDASGNTWWCNATPVPGAPSDGSEWSQQVTNDDTFGVCGDASGNWWWCDP